jgi:hypothetical protein
MIWPTGSSHIRGESSSKSLEHVPKLDIMFNVQIQSYRGIAKSVRTSGFAGRNARPARKAIAYRSKASTRRRIRHAILGIDKSRQCKSGPKWAKCLLSHRKDIPRHQQETSPTGVVSSIVTQISVPLRGEDDTISFVRKLPHLALPPCSGGPEDGWRLAGYTGIAKNFVAALKVSVCFGVDARDLHAAILTKTGLPVQIASCVPPMRHHPLPTLKFYLVLVMALLDLSQGDNRVSIVLAGLHILVNRSW